jgi:hypothetical protein
LCHHSNVSITWTWTDLGDALDTQAPIGLAGEVSYQFAPFTNDVAARWAFGTGSKVGPNRYRFTASFTAPLTPGTIYFQVTGTTFSNIFATTPYIGEYITPSAGRGEAPRTISIQ